MIIIVPIRIGPVIVIRTWAIIVSRRTEQADENSADQSPETWGHSTEVAMRSIIGVVAIDVMAA